MEDMIPASWPFLRDKAGIYYKSWSVHIKETRFLRTLLYSFLFSTSTFLFKQWLTGKRDNFSFHTFLLPPFYQKEWRILDRIVDISFLETIRSDGRLLRSLPLSFHVGSQRPEAWIQHEDKNGQDMRTQTRP